MNIEQTYTKREREIKYGMQGLFLMYGLPSLFADFMYVTGLEVLSNYIILLHIVKYIYLLPVLYYFLANKNIKNIFMIGMLFMIVMVVSALNFQGINMTMISSMVYFVAYTLITMICISLLKNPDIIMKKFRYISYIGCMEIITACVFGNILHIYDGYINYMVLGNGGLIYASVLIFWAMRERKIQDIILSCLVIACYVLFTSRGSLGALGCVILYFLFFGNIGVTSKKRIGWIMMLGSIGMVLLLNIKSILGFIVAIAQEQGWNMGKLLQAYLYFDSMLQSKSRIEIWQMAVELIKQNWLTGYGPMSSVRGVYSLGYDYAHNMELDILLDFGVVLGGAFIVLVFILLAMLLCAKKYRKWSSVCAVFVLPGFVVLQLSGYWYSVSYIFVLFFLFLLARKEYKVDSGGNDKC